MTKTALEPPPRVFRRIYL